VKGPDNRVDGGASPGRVSAPGLAAAWFDCFEEEFALSCRRLLEALRRQSLLEIQARRVIALQLNRT